MERGQQNHIVKSGYRCEQTPDLTIWRKSNQKYCFIGMWLTIKRPSHDKFLLANMCLPTPKKLANSCVHTSNTRQTRNMASLVQWHTRRVAASGLFLFYFFSSKKQQKAVEKQKGLGKTIHSKKSFLWRVQYARARA